MHVPLSNASHSGEKDHINENVLTENITEDAETVIQWGSHVYQIVRRYPASAPQDTQISGSTRDGRLVSALAPLPLVPAVGFVNLGHHLACPEGGSIVPETSVGKRRRGEKEERKLKHTKMPRSRAPKIAETKRVETLNLQADPSAN